MTDIKIAIVTPNRPGSYAGGVETYCHYLQRVFPNSIVVSARDQASRWAGVPSLPFVSDPQMALRALDPLRKSIVNGSLDAILCNGLFGWPLFLLKAHLPMVNVYHGLWAGFRRALVRTAKQRPSCSQRATFMANGFFERASGIGKTRVAVSPFVETLLEETYGLDSVVIPNCVDTEIFKPRDKADCRAIMGIGPDEKVCAFVGRPEPMKGFDLVDALALQNPDITFLVVGPEAPHVVRRNFRVRVDVDYESMPAIYSACDLVVLPSRFEGCSFVPLEAMACDVPVVTTNTGAFDDEMPMGCGIRITSMTIAAIEAAIFRILEHPAHYAPRNELPTAFRFESFRSSYTQLVESLLPE